VRFDPLRPIEDEVRRELSRFGPAAGLGDIVAAWPECVGAGIAANAWPARLARDGSLHVSTSSSAWAFELTHLAASILERLQEHLGESAPAALKFAPGALPEAGPEPVEASKRTAPKVSEADRAEGARIAATIENPHLREAVARAAEASLAAGSNRRT
jgi:predicted nucleic acid-binding Zn ribbon protein